MRHVSVSVQKLNTNEGLQSHTTLQFLSSSATCFGLTNQRQALFYRHLGKHNCTFSTQCILQFYVCALVNKYIWNTILHCTFARLLGYKLWPVSQAIIRPTCCPDHYEKTAQKRYVFTWDRDLIPAAKTLKRCKLKCGVNLDEKTIIF